MEMQMRSDAVSNEGPGWRRGYRASGWRVAGAVFLALGLWSAAGAAQSSTNGENSKRENSAVRASTTDSSQAEPTDNPAWQKQGMNGNLSLSLHGSGAVDVGFDKYTFPDNSSLFAEQFYDLRGRFVLGGDLDYEFTPTYFVHLRGQYVAWVREVAGTYQGNADDIYVQVGQREVWDIMLGRFLTWRVFRKGLGFDLFTLEDQGPPDNGQFGNVPFAPHIDEVSTIFFRGTQGRAALHWYPTPWSGIEIAGEYGRPDTNNSIGGRVAGTITLGPLSLSAAAEAKQTQPVQEVPNCPKCAVRFDSGYGGGAVLNLRVIEVGGNIALARTVGFRGANPLIGVGGDRDPQQSNTVTSFGGYLELDAGSFLFGRRLILGAGWDRSEFTFEDSEFLQHTQQAAYVAYPLGFNDALVKVVVSQGALITDRFETPDFLTERDNRLFSVRTRVSFRF
jgi:hypothetical protein